MAPAIVSLQQQYEELRKAELSRMQGRLSSLTPEQAAAVEALTRGLVNKFLHPPMQALKQAARDNDPERVEALCEVWSLPSTAEKEPHMASPAEPEKPAAPRDRETSTVASTVGSK